MASKFNLLLLTFIDQDHYEQMMQELPSGTFIIIRDNHPQGNGQMIMAGSDYKQLYDILSGQENSRQIVVGQF